MRSNLKFALLLFLLFSFSCPEIFSRNIHTVCASGCDFEYIQDAIDAASPGDIINVDTGVYTENLIINKPLVLSGSNAGISAGVNSGLRNQESVLKPAAGTAVLITDITAGTLKIDGFKISGESSWTNGGIVRTAIGEQGTSVKINNNIIITPNTAGTQAAAIQITGWGTEINGNLVDASNIEIQNWAGSGISVIGNTENVIIQENIIQGASMSDYAVNIELGFNETMNNINVSNNIIGNCYLGIRVFPGINFDNSQPISTIKNIFIENNEIFSCEEGVFCDGGYFPLGEIEEEQIISNNIVSSCSYGLHLSSPNWEISLNNIINNDIGIFIYQANNLEINNNIIIENLTYGIQRNGSVTVNASCNWWGTTSENEIEGFVSSGITYIPFLISGDLENALCVGGSPVYIWNGSEDNDWGNPQNWSEGSSPDQNSIVKIPPENEYLHPLIIGTEITCNLMEISETAVVTLSSTGSLNISIDLTNDGTLLISSDESGDGTLIVNISLFGNGKYEVERYLKQPGNYSNPPGGRYHLVSSPLTNVAAWTVFSGLYLFPHEEENYGWGTPISNPYYNIKPGMGYLIWTENATTRTFRGTINHGSIGPIILQRTYELPEDEQGWNLIGNPYPSVIDWDAESGWTKENLQNAVYVWNNDQYAAYINNVGTNGGSNFIAPGQGFFVRVSNGFNSGSIKMNNEVRTNEQTNFKNQNTGKQLIRIQINGNYSSDETVIYIDPHAQENFDENKDASKLFGAEHAPQLYTKKDENKLAIHSINVENQAIGKKVYLQTGATTEYSISFTDNLSGTNTLYLKDLITNETFSENQNYSFFASPDDISGRFMFVDSPAKISEVKDKHINVWFYNNLLYAELAPGQKLKKINIYNTLGTVVFNSYTAITDLNSLTPGIYIAEIKTYNQVEIKKILIQ